MADEQRCNSFVRAFHRLRGDQGDLFPRLRRRFCEYGAISKANGKTWMFAGVAVSSGVTDMLAGAEGSPKNTIRLQHVLVWVVKGGVWRLPLRQATRLPL